jgi:hypothetical protein
MQRFVSGVSQFTVFPLFFYPNPKTESFKNEQGFGESTFLK